MSQQGGYSYEKELRKYTKNKVMTTEKLQKANKLQSKIHTLTCNLHDLFDIRNNKIPATFNIRQRHSYSDAFYKLFETTT